MRKRSEQYVKDVEFIFEEVQRLETLARQSLHQVPKDDVQFTMPHPKFSHSMMLCGRAASLRITELAREACRRAKIEKRVEVSTAHRCMAEALVQRFLREERELNVSQLDRALNTVGKLLRGHCHTFTHFIPCHLMRTRDPDEIRVGPVVFRQIKAFRQHICPKVRNWRLEDDKRFKGAQALALDALRFYKNFSWVAEVEIQNCEKNVSRRIAERSITAALDCLHLLFRADGLDDMRIGGPGISRDKRGHLG